MRVIPIVGVMALVLAGCGGVSEKIAEKAAEKAIEQGLEAEGGGDVDIDLNEESGQIKVETEDGTQTMQMGGGEVPSELTIPLPDGYTVVMSMVTPGPDGTDILLNLEYPESSTSDLVAFYQDHFAGETDVSESNFSGDGSETWMWVSSNQNVSVTISHTEGDPVAYVTLTETTTS